MTRSIRDLSAGSDAMLALFADAALVRHALAFEAALAGAEAAEGLIPPAQARLIAETALALEVDLPALARAAAHAGTLAIPLVALLRRAVAKTDEAAARTVHRGATSQDLADTALMLQAQAGAGLIEKETARIVAALKVMAKAHTATPMLGRTLLQGALPVTFGLKAANWLLGLAEARARLARECEDALCLQFGGAAGTLAGLGGKAESVGARLAAELGLRPALPWQARRGALAGLAAALAILTGALAKMARDIALLSQNEIAELFEPRQEGRGGSSAMAHKRNPTGCQIALSAAARMPGLAATILAGLAQEQERGLCGWQAEGPVLADLFVLAHGALTAMAPVMEGLEIDASRMARNLAAAEVGEDVGESEALVARALAMAESG